MELLLTAGIGVLAGFVQGMSGFGGGIIAVTLLSLFLPLQVIVPLSIITSLVMNLVVTYRYRKACEYNILASMLLAALPGIALGIYVLTFISNSYAKLAIGILLLLFVGWKYSYRKAAQGQDHLWQRSLASFTAGFTFGATSLGGPPMAIYVLHAGWSPHKILGTTGLFFFFVSCLSIPGLAMANLLSFSLVKYAIILITSTTLGIYASFRFTKKNEMTSFVRSLLIVIFISAILCLYTSIREIFAI